MKQHKYRDIHLNSRWAKWPVNPLTSITKRPTWTCEFANLPNYQPWNVHLVGFQLRKIRHKSFSFSHTQNPERRIPWETTWLLFTSVFHSSWWFSRTGDIQTQYLMLFSPYQYRSYNCMHAWLVIFRWSRLGFYCDNYGSFTRLIQ